MQFLLFCFENLKRYRPFPQIYWGQFSLTLPSDATAALVLPILYRLLKNYSKFVMGIDNSIMLNYNSTIKRNCPTGKSL